MKAPRYSNDIALLKLAEKVDLNLYSPACLPTPNTDFTGKTGSVYGERLVILKTDPVLLFRYSVIFSHIEDQL